jgi:hypothetical protein
MNALALMLSLLLSHSASAEQSEMKVTVITGAEAEELYKSMGGHARNGGDTEATSQKFKVERSDNGLKQTVCTETFNDVSGRKSYKCKKEESTDGKELPEPESMPNPRRR